MQRLGPSDGYGAVCRTHVREMPINPEQFLQFARWAAIGLRRCRSPKTSLRLVAHGPSASLKSSVSASKVLRGILARKRMSMDSEEEWEGNAVQLGDYA